MKCSPLEHGSRGRASCHQGECGDVNRQRNAINHPSGETHGVSVSQFQEGVRASTEVRRALNANEYLRKRAADPSSPVAPGSSQSNPQTNRTTVRLSVKFVDDAR